MGKDLPVGRRLTRRAVLGAAASGFACLGIADSRSQRMKKTAPRFIEISHAIEEGMVTYPGLPPPEVHVIVDHDSSRAKYQGKSEFLIASLHCCGNTGTYVDSPLHRYRGATDLAGLPLERVAHVPVRVFDARDFERAVGPELFAGEDLRDCAVLVRTDFSQFWRSERYGRDNPYLTAQACEALVEAGAAFVGIDSLNVDDVTDLVRPAHTILLGAGIPVCEHMTNLEALPAQGGRLHAVPIAWRGGATFPVRAYVQYS